LTLLIALLLCNLAPAADNPRLPIPADPLVGKAEFQLKTIYKSEYAKPPLARRPFAKQLLEQAQTPSTDPATRFALFKEAANVAASSGDITTAIRAIDDFAKAFAIDAATYKSNAIVQSAKMIDSMPQAMVFLTTAKTLLEQFSAAGNPTAAMKVANTMNYVASLTRNRPIVDGVRTRVAQMKEVQAEFDRLKPAIERPPPSDRDGHMAAGKFACFFQDDWQTGLGRLMNCPDPRLKDIAARDVANPKLPDVRFALANAWWDFAQKQTGYARTRFQERAANWYRQSLPSLAVLDKAIAEKRILACVGAPQQATSFGGHAYIYDPTAMTFDEARLACELAGGHLAFVESEKEQQFLSEFVNGKRCWLGATDDQHEGDWTWLNGATLQFKSWHRGEPNNADGREHYLIMDPDGKWNDVPIGPSKNIGFICEWE
jgi:hypothetical protein